MTGWVRLWHDMPTDPKWRGIARRSGQSVAEVIAIFNFAMVNASANATERGRTHNLFADDIADALAMDEAAVQAVLDAMRDKVIDADGTLTGWEKRQPKREDNSAERSRRWRNERNRTQPNATERPDTDTDTDTDIPLAKANGASVDLDKIFWDGAKQYLGSNKSGQIGKWLKVHGREIVSAAIATAQSERAVEPVSFIEAVLKRRGQQVEWVSPC